MSKRSFTLVEVLVVAGIIGVISSVAVLNFSRFRARSRDQKRKADLLLVQTALELHFATNRTYPIPTTCGGAPVTPSGGVYYCFDPTNYVPTLAPQFIPVLPVDPSKGLVSDYAKSVSSYCASQPTGGYFYASNGKDYKVGAACSVETPIAAGDQFNDPNSLRAQGSFAVYSTGGKDF
ncbi:type II secretion system protein [Candidatus Berkelbacteria bacterium]|nr:type II secretion system protein [Candidatus Berkelbacteria bacterium]